MTQLDPNVMRDLYGEPEVSVNPMPQARKLNPQDVARGVQIQKQTGVDAILAAQRLPEFQDELDQDYWNKMVKESPKTAKFMAASPVNAALLQKDADSGALAAIEKHMGGALKYVMGNGDSTIGGDVKAAYHAASSGTAGMFGAVARTVGAPLGFLEKYPQMGGNPLFRLSEGFMQISDREAVAMKASAGKSATWLGGAVSSGVQSLAQNAPMMGLALLPGGQSAALSSMGAMTAGQTYQKDMASGDRSHWQSLLHATSDATIEVGTEMGPLSGLVGNIKAGTPLFTTMLKNAWQENKGEQVATALQDLNDWAVNDVNKGKTFADYLKERPEAAAQTAIATLVGAGGNVAIMQGVQTAVAQTQGRNRQLEYQAQQAEQHAQILQDIQKTAAATEVLGTNAETLTAYMQDLADEGVPQVFVDSAKLVEAGVDLQALAQTVPSIAAQLEQVESGGDLVIPTGELLAATLGTEFAQPLIDNARTDVNGMSRAEAQTYMQEKGDQVNAEIERVLAERQDDETFKAGRDEVQGQILTQLNEIKRFTPKVNEQYATLAANFYSVMAARTGMTVQDFAAKYKLGFSGQASAAQGGQVMDQAPASLTEPMKVVHQGWVRIASHEGAFKYAKSDKTDLKDVAQTVDAEFEVGDPIQSGDTTTYVLKTKELPSNHAAITVQGKEVKLDISNWKQGEAGSRVYAAVANWAHNNGLVFQEDDALTENSIYRRTENMLSSALKFGTTAHIAPGKYLLAGNKALGVAPLNWTTGDHEANIRSLIETSYQNVIAQLPILRGVRFDFESGKFLREDGTEVDEVRFKQVASTADARRARAGVATIKRQIVTHSLVREADSGRGGQVLALLDGWNADEQAGVARALPETLKGVLYQGDVKPGFDQTQTEAFKRWSNDAPLVDKASAETHEFKTGQKVALEAYHGTARPDRVGTVFQKKRATSGPMAFFTSNPELASSYAKGKADTSLANEDQDYANWFKYKPQGQRTPVDIVRAWYSLDSETKARIFELAPRVTYGEEQNEDGSNQIVLADEGHTNGTGSYDYNLQLTQRGYDKRGNPLKALTEDWLNSGNLFGDEEQFVKVLQLAGFPVKDVSYDSPQAAYPFVYKTYIEMQNPLVTSDVPVEVVDALKAAAKKDRSRAQTGGADMWDKNTRTLKEWVANYTDPANASAAFVWTSIPDKVTDIFKGMGYDGIVDWSGKGGGAIVSPVYIPFEETQVKSAIGNKGKFDPTKKDILKQDARGQIAMANDITQQASIISMFKNADLSTFIHEGGHFFLEVQADLATRMVQKLAQGETISDGERSILDDFNTTLGWMGVKADQDLSALDKWSLMTADEKRPYHEKWARGFESYAFEGKAPSLELQRMFQTFRAWLVNVYRKALKSINASKSDIADAMNVELSDEVRSVMDRMLATTEQIQEAEAARNMGPLFKTPEEGGMDMEAYKAYHDMGVQATQDAIQELQGKGLRDMQWLQNARSRKLKALQKQHDALRKRIEADVRADVMSQPIYRAWTFLTSRQVDKVEGAKPVGNAKGINPEVDNLFTAIAKLGGLDRAQVKSQWGLDEKEKLDSGVFGAPVVRKTGGLSLDAMAERLVEYGYMLPGENGADLAKFEELFDDQRRGTDRYSMSRDMAAAYGDALLNLPELPEVGYGKLRTEDLRRMYGTADDAIWRKLSELRMTSDEIGMDADVVAELFEFSSGDELVKTLATAEPPKSVIEGMTDQRMLEEHGDLATPAGLERAADAAIHNEARARFVATELRALEHATSVREKVPGQKNTVDVLAKAAKDYATQVIARLKVREVRPHQYAAAEARAAKAAVKATGDLAKQTMHKRNQLINLYATKAAYQAQDDVAKALDYFKKFDKASPSLGAEYADQIHALLERFDLRKGTSLKTIDKRKSLVQWLEGQAELGLEPNIPEDLLQEANRKSFKDMTVEEVRGLRDTIKQIEHIGRLKNKLIKARDQRDFDVVAAAMADSIVANGGEARPLELEGPGPVVDWFAGVAAAHRKLGSFFRQMDGNNDAGPMYQTIGRGMNESGTAEDVMSEKATKELQALYAPLLKLRGGVSGYRSKVFIPAIGASLTRGGRLAVALNWGNEANRQRIMDGDGWSGEQVGAVLNTLTPVELDFVNKVWEYLDSYWPEVAAKEKRLTGIEPEKVEAAPFVATASDGTKVSMRGGYYPIKYDANRSDRTAQQDAAQAAKEMIQGAFTRATTRRGHTKARAEAVNRAVRKDLNVITQHVSQVVHDLAWHEWLIDTNRLLSDKRVSGAIRDHYGPQVLKSMRDGILGIATADVVPQTKIDDALLVLRSNVTRATMGASLTTAFLQPFGLTQSMARIGPKHVLRGLARWGGDAVRMESTISWVHGKSDFMRLRAKTFNKELREIRGTVAGKSKAMQAVDGGLFYMMQKMQMVADVPTWIGQYEKSTAEGLDEAAAVAMADRAVLESQGGGQTKDLAEVQRKHPMLTQFYSYFSVTLNLTIEQTAKTDFKNPRAVAGWLGDMALLSVIPAILPAMIMFLLKGGEEDEPEGWAKRMAEWQVGYLMGAVVGLRELTGAMAGFDYAGPPVGRLVGDLGKVGKQAGQGEVDEPAVLALTQLIGTAFGVPVTQALRSYKGWKAWDEGQEGAGPQSALFGPPPKD